MQWGRALEKLLAQRLGDAYRQLEKALLVAVCCRRCHGQCCLEGSKSRDHLWLGHAKENFVSAEGRGLSGCSSWAELVQLQACLAVCHQTEDMQVPASAARS